jgi:energy-converting hydrogenase Eha subunit A
LLFRKWSILSILPNFWKVSTISSSVIASMILGVPVTKMILYSYDIKTSTIFRPAPIITLTPELEEEGTLMW